MTPRLAGAARAPRERLHHRGLILERISSRVEVERLRPEWEELLGDSDASTFFLTWEWLAAWTDHLMRGELALLVVREEGRLIALAPFFAQPAPLIHAIPSTRWRFLGSGTAGSDYLDLVLRRGREAQACALIADHLAGQGVSVEMANVRGGPAGADAMVSALEARGWRTHSREINVCPYIPLQDLTWDGYLASLGSEHRYNFNRRQKSLRRTFRVELESASTEAQREQGLTALLALHAKRWEERGGSDAFNDPALERFHHDVTRRALHRGWLRLFTLRLDGEAAASLYGISHGGVFSFYQSGMEPRFSTHSVGLVLMGLCIQAAIAEGAREFDLLHGAERYKALWAPRSRAIRRLLLTPPGVRGRLAHEEARLRQLAGAAADRFLPAALRRRIAWWRGADLQTPTKGGRR
ncbi:MAG: GNAT family N-acetyltransferase [Candidatus Polarisedimenticolia bacterium]